MIIFRTEVLSRHPLDKIIPYIKLKCGLRLSLFTFIYPGSTSSKFIYPVLKSSIKTFDIVVMVFKPIESLRWISWLVVVVILQGCQLLWPSRLHISRNVSTYRLLNTIVLSSNSKYLLDTIWLRTSLEWLGISLIPVSVPRLIVTTFRSWDCSFLQSRVFIVLYALVKSIMHEYISLIFRFFYRTNSDNIVFLVPISSINPTTIWTDLVRIFTYFGSKTTSNPDVSSLLLKTHFLISDFRNEYNAFGVYIRSHEYFRWNI